MRFPVRRLVRRNFNVNFSFRIGPGAVEGQHHKQQTTHREGLGAAKWSRIRYTCCFPLSLFMTAHYEINKTGTACKSSASVGE